MSDEQPALSPIMSALYQKDFDAAEALAHDADSLSFIELVALGRPHEVEEAIFNDASLVSQKAPDGFFPIHLAAFFARVDVVRILLDADANADVVADQLSRVASIHAAAASGSADVVRLLLEAGANPDAQQHGGWTALHSAAKHGNVAMVRVLLENGADRDIEADDGSTALSLATDSSQTEVVKLLGR